MIRRSCGLIKALLAIGLFIGIATDPGRAGTHITDLSAETLPLGWWKLDEARGKLARDDGAGARDAELRGRTAWTEGALEGGLRFRGVEDFASVEKPSYAIEDAITLSVWVKTSRDASGASSLCIFGKCGVYELRLRGKAMRPQVVLAIPGAKESENERVECTGPDPLGGGWHHLAATYDAREPKRSLRLYLDGELANECRVRGGKGRIVEKDKPFTIGGDPRLSVEREVAIRTLDDARIHARALSPEEIREVFLTAGPEPPPAAPAGFRATPETSSSIHLSWTAGGVAAGFAIERRDAESNGSFVAIADLPGSLDEYQDAGLRAGTLQVYRIRAYGPGGFSAFSPQLAAETDPDADTPPPATPLGWWKLDEGRGASARDHGSAGRDGALQGKPKWSAGQQGTALALDGADDFVSIGNHPEHRLAGAITLSAWVKANPRDPKSEPNPGLIGKSSSYALRLRSRTARPQLVLHLPGAAEANEYGYVLCTAPSGLDSGWHHVAGTYDSRRRYLRVYVDGAQVAECRVRGGKARFSESNGALEIGRWKPNRSFLSGLLDDVRIYDRELRLDEIFRQWVVGTPALDDAFEPNDGISQAMPLPFEAQSHAHLIAGETRPDFYQIPVPTGAGLAIEIGFRGDLADLDLALLDPSGQPVGSREPGEHSERVVAEGLAAGTYTVSVTWSPSPESWAYYSLDVRPRGTSPQTPRISVLEPAVGALEGGTPVLLTGSGFRGTESLFFGAAPAPYFLVIGDTQLLALAPEGSGSVALTVGSSPAAGAAVFDYRTPAGHFASGGRLDLGGAPASVLGLAADLDGDGLPELATLDPQQGTISIRSNESSPGALALGPELRLSLPGFPASWTPILSADFDFDGRPDLALGWGSELLLFRNETSTGGIHFGSATAAASGYAPFAAVGAADLDGDGRVDLLAAQGMEQERLLVFRNLSAGGGSFSFEAIPIETAGSSSSLLRVADFDGDRKADVATADPSRPEISIRLNRSTGPGDIAFDSSLRLATADAPLAMEAADFNADGRMDLFVLLQDAPGLLHENLPVAGAPFSEIMRLPIMETAGWRAIEAADLDANGRPDLLGARAGSRTLEILKNASSGSDLAFAVVGGWDSVDTLERIESADFDGDGRRDVAVSGENGSVALLVNASLPRVSFGSPSASVSESSAVLDLEALLEAPAAAEISVDYTLAGGTATPGEDFRLVPGRLVFAPGETRALFSIEVLQDGLVEPDETIELELRDPVGAALGAVSRTTLVLVDDDAEPPAVGFDARASSGPETTVIAAIGLSLSRPQLDPVTVQVRFGGTALAGEDYASPANVSFPAGATAAVLAIEIRDDGIQEPDESIELTLLDPVNAVLGASEHTYTIRGDLPGALEVVRVSPAAGPRTGGTEVRIFGAGFTSGVSQVLFGQEPASFFILGETQIVAVAPAGTGAVDVVVKAADGRDSSLPAGDERDDFAYRGEPGPARWAEPEHIATWATASVGTIAAGELAGGAASDLAVATSEGIEVFRNQSSAGDFSFVPSSAVTPALPFFADTLALADLDSDHRLDLAAAGGPGRIAVFPNLSAGDGIAFGSRVDLSSPLPGDGPDELAFFDLDLDGKIDLASSNGASAGVAVFPNATAGGSLAFAPPVSWSLSSGSSAIAVGDFDSDRSPDLASTGAGALRIRTASGLDLSFGMGMEAAEIAAADLDGDGRTDLAAIVPTEPRVLVLRNTSAGGGLDLEPVPVELPWDGVGVAPRPARLALADVDADGRPDLIVADLGTSSLSILENDSTPGTVLFEQQAGVLLSGPPLGLAASDFDADGRIDLAVTQGPPDAGGVWRLSVIGNLVQRASAPVANAGPDRTILDEDEDGSESVTLDGTASTDEDGDIETYRWTRDGQILGQGPTVVAELPIGTHRVTLEVTDGTNLSASDEVVVTIAPGGLQAPVITPPAGTFPGSVAITLSSPTPGATVYYTTDGSDPGFSSPSFAGSRSLVRYADTIVKAKAVLHPAESAVVEARFVVATTLDAPAIRPASGAYGSSLSVEVSTGDARAVEANAQLHYSLDRGATWQIYQTPVLLNAPPQSSQSFTFQARLVPAVPSYATSPVSEAAFVLDGNVLSAPLISPAGGVFDSPPLVSLQAHPADAILYFTTDGSDPASPSSARIRYQAPFVIYRSAKVRAYAEGSGFGASALSEAQFVIVPASTGIPGFEGVPVGEGSAGSSGTFSDGTWLVSGTGAGIEAWHDSLYYEHAARSGNFEIEVRIRHLEGADASAGLMVREGLGSEDRFVSIGIDGGSYLRASRTRRGEAAVGPLASSSHDPAGAWMKVRRVRDQVTVFTSADGSSWTTVDTVNLTGLSPTVETGLYAFGAGTGSAAVFGDYRVSILPDTGPAPGADLWYVQTPEELIQKLDYRVLGMSLDGSGTLFLTSWQYEGPTGVFTLSPSGDLAHLAGTFDSSTGCNEGPASNVHTAWQPLVVDRRNGDIYGAIYQSIHKLSPDLTVKTYAGGCSIGDVGGHADGLGGAARFDGPRAMVIDAQGRLYLADLNNHVIRRISPDPSGLGRVETIAGAPGQAGYQDGVGANARLHSPRGIVLDGQGGLYVSEQGNHTIRRIDLATLAVTTVAGSPTPGYANGAALDARFDSPAGLTLDLEGNLYVADSNNNRIRRIDPSGNVTTFAGSGLAEMNDGFAGEAGFRWPIEILYDPFQDRFYVIHFHEQLRFIERVPPNADTDKDGLPDRWEMAFGLDPHDDGTIDPRNSAQGDFDGDGVSNLDELLRGTDPSDPESKNATLYVDSVGGHDSYNGLYSLRDGSDFEGRVNGPKKSIDSALREVRADGDRIQVKGYGEENRYREPPVLPTAGLDAELDPVDHVVVDGTNPTPRAAAPVFQPNGGTFSQPVTVVLQTATPGGAIHFTTDGTTPSFRSPRYEGPITLPFSCRVRAIATGPGFLDSAISEAEFVIDASVRLATTDPVMEFGRAVEVNGTRAVVAAPRIELEDPGVSSAVYVYAWNGSGWVQETKLSTGVANDDFGSSVALFGNQLVVGAPGFNGQGAVFLYEPGADGFITKLGWQAGWAEFGASVAMDGKLLVAGAPGDGLALLVEWDGFSMDWIGNLRPSNAAIRFGAALDISGDTIVVGSEGAAYVFEPDASGSWTERAILLPGDGDVARFGTSVAIAKDTILVGAQEAADKAGAAYVFVRTGAGWSRQAKLTVPGGAPLDRFGAAVDVAGDRALVGAPGDLAQPGTGSKAYLFSRSGAEWALTRILAPGGAVERYGAAVSLPRTGGWLIVGSPGNPYSGEIGEAYLTGFTR